jgi:1-deoxy-D-xylulose 5-phosphate reductoisomerase
VEKTLQNIDLNDPQCLDEVLEIDARARRCAETLL